MSWVPTKRVSSAVKFYIDCLQGAAIIVGVISAALTYSNQVREQKERAIEQGQRATEQLAATQRELQRPYDEKKLQVYVEISRVVAHLSKTNGQDPATELRFWELYWGEMPFVGSAWMDELTWRFCAEYFGNDRCTLGNQSDIVTNRLAKIAVDISHGGRDEIAERWKGKAKE